MTYKPTEPKWVLTRLAYFSAWPGLPAFLLMEWLTSALWWQSLLVAAFCVSICELLVESIRYQNDDDGEHHG